MPLSGGATDKFGNRYEGRWTAQCMIDVMTGHADSIRLEPPGIEGEGIEFFLKISDTTHYHQVKRQTSTGHWSLTDLANKKVLNSFWKKLVDAKALCYFVSMYAAKELDELSDRVRRASSFDEFKKEFLKDKSSASAFHELCTYWENCSEADAYEALKRIRIVSIDEETLLNSIERELRNLVDGNSLTVIDVLCQLALDKVHYELNAQDIWQHLESRGHHRILLTAPDLNFENLYPVAQDFVGRHDALTELSSAIERHNVVVIGGIVGIGKTYLVSQFVSLIDDKIRLLWLDCNNYRQIEHVLSHIANLLNSKFKDSTLNYALSSSPIDENARIEIAVDALDKNKCLIVWDNFDQTLNSSLLVFLKVFNQTARHSKLIITTREWIKTDDLLNVVYHFTLSPLNQSESIELMKQYASQLGLNNFSHSLLFQAFERVGGHPHFLRSLMVLAEIFPLPDLLQSLPQFIEAAHSYIQQQIFEHLDSRTKGLLGKLCVLRTPFLLSAVELLDSSTDAPRIFEGIIRKFLATRFSKSSSYYEIHDLIREHGIAQISPDEINFAHSQAITYYNSLGEESKHLDIQEVIFHALEVNLIDDAVEATRNLLGWALYHGSFDYVIEFSSELLKDQRLQNEGQIYYAQGRALRFKKQTEKAIRAYRFALDFAEGKELQEAAKNEIASVLILQADEEEYTQEEKTAFREEARNHYLDLAEHSDDTVRKVSALCALAMSDSNGQIALERLQIALSLAKEGNLERELAGVYQALGDVYISNFDDTEQALKNFETALRIREEKKIREKFGWQEVEAEIHLYQYLTSLYDETGKFEEAIKTGKTCVYLAKQLGLEQTISYSLYVIGRNECFISKYNQSIDTLQESLSIMETYGVLNDSDNIAKASVLEWLAFAFWYTAKFENSIEYILEYSQECEKNRLPAMPYVVALEKNLRSPTQINPCIVQIGTEKVHLLLLPPYYTLDQINVWLVNVVERRPDLAGVKSILSAITDPMIGINLRSN